MAGPKFKNNATSTLAGSITNSQTSFSVAAGQGARFPSLGAGEYFRACLIASNGDRELIKVTARATDTFTVDRAQEGTTGLPFDSGSRVELRLTAAEIERFWNPDNDGAGSGLDADLLDGMQPSASPTNNTIVQRDSGGDVYANDFVGNGATLAGDADVSGNVNAGGNVAVGGVLNESKGADIASAATVDLDAATGNLVRITGTTGITAITLAEGAERTVLFTGALTITHGANLLLPNGQNITTAANTIAVFRGLGGGVTACVACSVAARGGRLVDIQVFHGANNWDAGAGTWTKPANLSPDAFCIIDGCGGGGQGGGAAATAAGQASVGSGGGCAPRVTLKVKASSLAATCAVTTGAGGYGAAAGADGALGGSTTFTSGTDSLTIYGGKGGYCMAAGTSFAVTSSPAIPFTAFLNSLPDSTVIMGPMGTAGLYGVNRWDGEADPAIRWSGTQAVPSRGARSPMTGESGGRAYGNYTHYEAFGAGSGGQSNIGLASARSAEAGAPGVLVVYTYD